VTEIPEHLLKRAAERRAAMTGGAAPTEGGDAAPAPAAGEAVAPAAAEAAPAKQQAPLPTLDAEPTPVVPDSPVVAAAKSRKRVPFWAAPVLALLPLWAFIYVYSVQPPPAGDNDPLVIGKEVYTSAGCQGCHGPAGGGDGGGAVLADGEVINTFADPLSMVHWIGYGYTEGARPDGTYGDLDRPGGPRNIADLSNQMAAYRDTLSVEELAAVTLYIRSEFGGDLYDPENEQGFTVEAFEADPLALEEQVQESLDLGPGGDPDVASIERGE
jgi:mono/diheme cytochrome c family protein